MKIRQRYCAALAALLLLVGCGANDVTAAGETAPTISIAGILDGASYDGAVSISIGIDRGSYQATLDGAPFISGDTVRTPGAHTVSITAQAGTATAARTLHFTIQAPSNGVVLIRMLNLGANDAGGGGDAILITDSSSAGMVHALIDAGPSGVNAGDPSFVERQLMALHVDTLALLVLTHAHDDHYGGMAPILSAVKVKRFVYNGQVRSLASYNAILSQARAVADSTITLGALRSYALGYSAAPAQLALLPPLTTWLATSTDDGDQLNDGSIGARLDVGSFSMLFTGDGETGAIAHWRSAFSAMVSNVTILKVGHHGANNAVFDNGFSGAASWLSTTAPKVSLISANGTTHPRIFALNAILALFGNQTYCTNVHGNITVRVARSGSYTVTPEKNAGATCAAGSGATT